MRTLRVLASIAALAPFAGCVSDVGPMNDGLGERGDPLTYCGGGKYVEGVDVSHWQTKGIDWKKVKASGREFAFMKVTEGTGFVDDAFKINWAGSKAAGLIRGAYHFHRTNADPIAQAEHFVKNVGPLAPDDFPLMLDVEDAKSPPPAAEITANVKACLQHIEKLTGRVPIIYTGNWYWSGHMGNPKGFDKYPLWIAAYPKSWPSDSYCPTVPGSWKKWTFWQYSSGANGVPPVPGVGQSCDRNLFDGTLADLMAFVGAKPVDVFKASYVEQSWPLASAPPVPMKVGETQTGFIKLKNTGTTIWKAGQVLLAPIPRDKASAFQSPSWPSATRVSAVKSDVAPGEVGTFSWDLTPSQPGDFKPYFGLVAEGITWFADAPKGGGPEDDVLQVSVTVAPAEPGTGGSSGSGAGQGGSSAGGSAEGGASGTGGSAEGGTSGSGAGQAGKAGSGGGGSGGAGKTGAGGQASSSAGQSGAAGAVGKGGTTAKGGASGTAAEGDDGASTGAPVIQTLEPTDESGGCSSAGRGGAGAGWPFALLALAAAMRRRRV